jgi:hypothetical protein
MTESENDPDQEKSFYAYQSAFMHEACMTLSAENFPSKPAHGLQNS